MILIEIADFFIMVCFTFKMTAFKVDREFPKASFTRRD